MSVLIGARRLAANVASLGTAKVAADGLHVVLLVLLARELGAADFGVYGLGMALGGVASLAVGFGWRNLVMRDAAAGREAAANLLGAALGAQALCLLAIAALSPVLLWLPDATRPMAAGLYALILYQCLQRVLMVLRAWFTAHEESGFSAGFDVLEKSLALLLGLTLLFATRSLWPTLAAFPAAAALACAAALVLGTRRYGAPRLAGAFRGIGGRLRAALPFFLLLLAATLLDRSGVLVLAWFHAPEVVGVYSAAERLVAAGLAAIVLSAAAFQPVFARLSRQAPAEAVRLLRRALLLAALLVLPLSLLGVALAEPVMIRLFGDQFAGSVQPLRILAAMLLPMTLYTLLAQWMLATGGHGRLLGAQCVALVWFALLLAWLVPAGAETGLAWARTLGSLVLLLSLGIAIRSRRKHEEAASSGS